MPESDSLARGYAALFEQRLQSALRTRKLYHRRMWVWDVALAAIVAAEVVALNSRAFPPLSKWLRRRLRVHTSAGMAVLVGLFVWLAAHLRDDQGLKG